MPRFQHLNADCTERHQLEVLREAADPLLATEILLHHTDHSVAHSDRLVEYVDQLVQTRGRETNCPLSVDELAVLYGSCYLHDLGMHIEAAGELESVVGSLGGRKWSEVGRLEQHDVLRKQHHRISAELICRAARGLSPCGQLPVQELHPDEIAAVCEAHNLCIEHQRDLDQYGKLTVPRSGLRLDLISALLRLADILDESHHRACREKARMLELDELAQTHWWRHYYTEHIELAVATRTITLEFKFPTARTQEYEPVVPKLQLPAIQDELGRQQAVLVAHELPWRVERGTITPSMTKKEMPNAVFLALVQQLQQRETADRDRERIAALGYLRVARPVVRAEQESLETRCGEFSPADYMAKAWELAGRLRSLGGEHEGCELLSRAYERTKAALETEPRIDYAVRLAQWRQEDANAFWAMNVLQEVHLVLPKVPANSPVHLAYWTARFQGLCDLAVHYPDALAAGKEAMRLAPSSDVQRHLLADLTEMAFLQAEPADALDLLKAHHALFADVDGEHGGRCRLLLWRLMAMSGLLSDVLQQMDARERQPGCTSADVVRMLSFKAELLFLAGRLAEAHDIMATRLWPLIKDLSPQEAGVHRECYQTIAISALVKAPVVGFSEQYDERRMLHIVGTDEQPALFGYDAAAREEHYDSMAYFWRAARAAYRLGRWPAFKTGCQRLSRECLATNCLSDAVFFALLAHDEAATKALCSALSRRPRADLVAKAIRLVLRFGRLPIHAKVACDVLQAASDAIADDMVGETAQYLLAMANHRSETPFSSWQLADAAWQAIERLVPRLPPAVVAEVIDAVVHSSGWQTATVQRRYFVGVLSASVPHAPPDGMPALAEACLPLATTAKWDFDFGESVMLLVRIAERGGPGVAALIGGALYQHGSFGNSGLLLQVMRVFSVVPSQAELAKFARDVLRSLEQEVVVTSPDAPPIERGNRSFTRVVDGKRIVTRAMPAPAAAGIAAHFEQLPCELRSSLWRAMMANLENAEDIIPNKTTIVQLLAQMWPHLALEEQAKTRDALVNIAELGVPWPSGVQTPEQRQNPFERFRMAVGKPGDVIGMAVRSLALIAEGSPTGASDRLLGAIERNLLHPDADVRRHALLALQRPIPRSGHVLARVLVATRDEDPVTAAAALYVFAACEPALLAPHLDALSYSLASACRSDDSRLRKAAAHLTGRLQASGGANNTTLPAEIPPLFASDPCHSVRTALADGMASASAAKTGCSPGAVTA